jgi:hypothetical protein
MIEGKSWPAKSFRIKSFHRKLTLDDLLRQCAQHPNPDRDHRKQE